MKVKSEDEWQGQLASFAADTDPMAEVLPNFIIAWCERAERFMEEADDVPTPPWTTPIGALRAGLRATEEDSGGKLQIGYLGMALVIICAHWEPAGSPDDFYQTLTPIEQNLFADVAAMKLLAMELEAQSSGQSNG